ncbi:MAG: NAD-dependent epimerase/dehydratase family protein [Saprospirales bacterium]|nr:NAD-dependent epimerase/dehydratase family protein [Saprospirales bacterium]
MRVLITGADGLLGSHLVRELLADGHEVNAFVHHQSTSPTLSGLPVRRFKGDILNARDLETAIQNCEVVIHAAANTSVWPTRSELTRRVNLEGTQRVAEAALRQGVRRFIYISSASAFQPGPKSNPGDESRPYVEGSLPLDYIESKYHAQQFVLKAVEEQGLPAVIINPTFMFGEYDSLPSSGKMILAIHQGKLPGYSSGGKNFVYAKDVARASINAITKGRLGECYIAGNSNLSYRELFDAIACVTGAKPPRIKFPDALMLSYGYIGTLIGTVFRQPPTLNHATAKVSCMGQYYSPQKAVAELDLPQTPIETAIRSAFDWFNQHQYC